MPLCVYWGRGWKQCLAQHPMPESAPLTPSRLFAHSAQNPWQLGWGRGSEPANVFSSRKALKWFYHCLCHMEKVSDIPPRSLLKSSGKEYLKKILCSIFACPLCPHTLSVSPTSSAGGKYLLKSSVPTEGDQSCLSSVSIFLYIKSLPPINLLE